MLYPSPRTRAAE